jgi:hypothetical protein
MVLMQAKHDVKELIPPGWQHEQNRLFCLQSLVQPLMEIISSLIMWFLSLFG